MATKKAFHRVGILVVTALVAFLAVSGILSLTAEKSLAMEVYTASCSITAAPVDPDEPNGEFHIAVTYNTTGTNGWHVIEDSYWLTRTYGFTGLMGSQIVTWTYPYGEHVVSFTTDLYDGDEPSCQDSIVIVYEEPAEPPTGTLNVEVVEGNYGRNVSANGTYSNTGDWMACLDWRDGSAQTCFPGTEGSFDSIDHTYTDYGLVTPTLYVSDGAVTTTVEHPMILVAPDVDLSLHVDIVDLDTRMVNASGTATNMASSTIYWGDGYTSTVPSESYGIEHQYAWYGAYDILIEATGHDGSTFTETAQVNFPMPGAPEGVLNAEVTDEDHLEVMATGWYSADNACLDWGDDSEVCSPGLVEVFTETHQYLVPDVYTLTLTLENAARVVSYTQVVDFNVTPPQTTTSFLYLPVVFSSPPITPAPTIEVDQNWTSPYAVEFTVEIAGAANAWHVFYFGDGAEFGLEGNGVFSFPHVYNPGNWTAVLEVSGSGGTTVWSEVITSPHG